MSADEVSTDEAPAATHVVAVVLDDRLITFTRVVGLLRRRNLSVSSIAVGPTSAPGLSRLTVVLRGDRSVAARAVLYLQKVIGVRDVVTFPMAEGTSRELALVKVRVPPGLGGEVRDAVQRYRCTVVDEGPEAMTLEVTGAEPGIRSCLEALARFGVLEVARTGPAAVDRRYPVHH